MELKLPEERYIAGESVIVEDIATDGACILLTKNMQAELAFAVTRFDVSHTSKLITFSRGNHTHTPNIVMIFQKIT